MNIDWESLLKLLQSGGDQPSPSAGLMQLAGGSRPWTSYQTEKALREMEKSNAPVPVQELQNIRSPGFYSKPDPNLTRTLPDGRKVSDKDYQALERARRARDAALMLSQ